MDAMKIDLNFKNINTVGSKMPEIAVELSGRVLYTGQIKDQIVLKTTAQDSKFDLKIYFTNKEPEDTIIDYLGNIIQDLNFELETISIDDIDLENLKWQSHYVHGSEISIPGCLFFGPKGHWQLSAYLPILRWKLDTNHQLLQNDINWEEDYNYYCQALCLLKNLYTR